MTSPTLSADPAPPIPLRGRSSRRLRLPILLFFITLLTTTAVGMRYMYNFNLNRPPFSSDADVLPFGWAFAHLSSFASGLPFSLTLIGILLAHEFGHYLACRSFGVDATLPYLLPAPSLSGSFGAVIRLRSRVPSRAALIVIGATGPVAGFLVAVCTVLIGISLSRYAPHPVMHDVQAPLLLSGLQALLRPGQPIALLLPHPVLIASWMGILITALNLIPAGQLDGGHIVYGISPTAHRISHWSVVAGLVLLGIFAWAGWILWALILLTPAMRHPKVPKSADERRWHLLLVPACLLVLLLSATYAPFKGYSLLEMLREIPHHF